jgi:circadian clock protein KaiB
MSTGYETTRYELTLFVCGASELSARAIANTQVLCEGHLRGHYQLSVVDVNEEPAMAAIHKVVAAPTLVKHRPLPRRKLVGDLADTGMVLLSLEIPIADHVAAAGWPA